MRPSTPEQDIKKLHKKFQMLAERDFNMKTPQNRSPAFNTMTARNSIVDSKTPLDFKNASYRRNTSGMMAGTDVKQIRLNPHALELLNSVDASLTGQNLDRIDRKNS